MFSILLVDDEKWVRTTLKWTINQLNLPFHISHECENGLEALDWMKQNEIDLIFTDVSMPVMDGLTFVKELRQFKKDQDTIVISVHDEFHFVQHAIRSGVTDYLLKPIEEFDLKLCLEKWLDKRKGEEEKKEDITYEDLPTSTIDQVLFYLKNTPLSEITLKEAADRVHMNPSYLSQLFKQQLNKKFVDYLTELRIDEAKRLLLYTSLRISEIADRVGYSDLAYFSNNFKRITGSSPSDFRKSTD
ncbi:AraC family transcriptional regulator [Bacillus sp. SA1-12]|uniref:response regulator transcription factor n=1 Tax=Bacillus sp. SA1-12 TaxID=1455638 RepID=UPI000626E7EB|nr:helix-turn-helix domain-containing protein [Bacillus sp. SA1-12]KKI94162.1 AraC family transcriptional regulator [Bacillus sp. SA1-12]